MYVIVTAVNIEVKIGNITEGYIKVGYGGFGALSTNFGLGLMIYHLYKHTLTC